LVLITLNAGGLGMVAIGVGGRCSGCNVRDGMGIKIPKLIGVKLTGKLSGWVSPKDVIPKLPGFLLLKEELVL
jgi:aconitate hydratase